MRKFHVNDTDYGPDDILELREHVIMFRDAALKQNDFHAAITLSITIALLAKLAEVAGEDEPPVIGDLT